MLRSLETEIALRAIQGLAGGAFGVAAFGLTFRAFGGRNLAFGLMLLTFAQTFPANLGAVLAGYLTSTEVGWPLVYVIEVALALIVFVEALQSSDVLPAFNWRVIGATDWVGYALIASGLGLVIVGVSQGARRFWWDNQMVVATLGLGLALIAIFVAIEWGRRDGIVDFKLLGRRSFSAAILLNIFFRVGLLTTSYLDPQFLSQLRSYRPLEATEIMWTTALVQLVAFPFTYWLLRHLAPRKVIFLGLACFAAAPALLIGADSRWAGQQFMISHALLGAAAPFFIVPLLVIGTRDVKPSEGASASTFFNGSRSLTQQIGTALLATLIRKREQFHSGALSEAITPARLALDGRSESIQALIGRVRTQAFTLAYIDAFLLVAGLLAIAAMLTFTFPPVRRLGAEG
jgi:DHA2 family multidrug resistance protein